MHVFGPSRHAHPTRLVVSLVDFTCAGAEFALTWMKNSNDYPLDETPRRR